MVLNLIILIKFRTNSLLKLKFGLELNLKEKGELFKGIKNILKQ